MKCPFRAKPATAKQLQTSAYRARKSCAKALIAVILPLCLLIGAPVSDARADVTPEQVRESISKAVNFLKRKQRAKGSWDESTVVRGGISSLCALALLNAGVDSKNPQIQKALDALRSMNISSTYALSLQTMVFCKAGYSTDLPKIRENVRWLQTSQIVSGPNTGAWTYGITGAPSGGDKSNTQFALLALHEAERVGVEVDPKTWRLSKAYWERFQNADGAWRYQGGPYSGSMTCAGIASLVITSSKTRQSNASATGDRVQCCLATDDESDGIEQGLKWLGRRGNFAVDRNPGHGRNSQHYLYYYLYGLERVGRLTGQRFIGGHDWYREGCEFLIREQDDLSGFFRSKVDGAEKNELIATSLALLFLSKGRRPVLMAKLDHTGPQWNAHRSDVAHLTQFVESRWEFDMIWQTVDVHAATVEDLLQSPVVYMCGKQSPLPKSPAAQKELARKLRDYLDRGGFLFAEAFQDGSSFDREFRKLMDLVFPEPEYKLHVLEDHPVWYAEIRVKPDQMRPLLGIEFGCRTSVIYAPPEPSRPSLSCLWELSENGRGKAFTPQVQSQIDGALAIGINVLAYATNRELEGGEERFTNRARPQDDGKTDRAKLYIAKLRHPGGCNAAPRALANLLETANTQLHFRADVRKDLLDMTDKALFDHHLVFMHGRRTFRLTAAERTALRTYVERGGVLFADSICAAEPFSKALRTEMAAIFPEKKIEPIPAGDPMFTRAYGGSDLKSVSRRVPQRRGSNDPLNARTQKGPPQLEGIRSDDRWGVIFSPFDISCALEKHDSLECNGYVREDAAKIGLNVILYSLQP